MIRLTNVTFGFESVKPFLKDLCFEFVPGDRVGIIGSNGSGKTTLFHLMMGLLYPLRGEIEIFGELRQREADFHEVRRRIGLLFQDPDDQLFCPSVAEDVAFGPLNLGKSRKETEEIVRQTLERLGLQGFEGRITHQLSGGEKRLVSLATVLAMSPEILLLDEPTNGLHEDTVEQVASILKNSAPSYLIISHDRDFLARTTERVYELANGVLVPGDRLAVQIRFWR